jgi:hypothetical protein
MIPVPGGEESMKFAHLDRHLGARCHTHLAFIPCMEGPSFEPLPKLTSRFTASTPGQIEGAVCMWLAFCCLMGARQVFRLSPHSSERRLNGSPSILETAESAAYSSLRRKKRDVQPGVSTITPRAESGLASQAVSVNFNVVLGAGNLRFPCLSFP